MADPTPLSQTDIANLALAEIGQQPISSIEDTTSNAARICSSVFWHCVGKVGRSHNWNCLQRRQDLTQLNLPGGGEDSTAIGWRGCAPTTLPPYWLANTNYVGGNLVTWGQAIYYCLQANLSSGNFVNDVTLGLWAQLYSTFLGPFSPGHANGYEWNYGFVLPQDYLLITELNGNDCRRGLGIGSLFELFTYRTANPDQSQSNVMALFCNAAVANVKYTALIPDTTLYDECFVDAVAMFLAAKVATTLRKDDGKMSSNLRNRYKMDVLPEAILKDSGERKERRYDPTKESNFLRSRWNSTNG